jgi:5-methyltetrahydrofolate corrinoid/iron sulfur protein methyltransferase
VTDAEGAPMFITIGENIHCSRVVKRQGVRGGVAPDGRPGVRFPDGDGGEAWVPLPDSILQSKEFTTSERIKHVMAAVRVGLAGGADADVATAYVAWMAKRQIDGGAAYLDLNVDEIDPNVEGRLAAMIWMVNAVGPVSSIPLAIDSSDAAVLEAGLDAIDPAWADGATPMVNSASVERPEVLELCKQRGSPVVLSCTGNSMPSGTDDRVERAEEIIGMAYALGLPADSLFVDPLVIPIGVDPMAGQAYLAAVSTIRDRFGHEIHITGGISNISFGLPARRLITDTFMDLCVQAGHDSGIVDPAAADIQAALQPDRTTEGYTLAMAMLTGEDAFGMQFIEAFRAGKLS